MIIVYVRSTEDWDNFNCFDLLFKSDTEFTSGFVLSKQVVNKLIEKIGRWDEFLDVKYFKYRSLLKKLAQSTWANYKVCYSFDELTKIVTDEDFICPSDDDDWFRSDLLEAVPKYIEDADFLYWDHVVHMTHEFGPHRWYHCHSNMGSNNYAINGKSFKAMSREHQKSLVDNENSLFDICEKLKLKKNKTDDLLLCYL